VCTKQHTLGRAESGSPLTSALYVMKITNEGLFGYTIIAISLCAAMAYANYNIPYCSLSLKTEGILTAASLLLIFIVVGPIAFYAHSLGKNGKKYIALVFFIFFSSAPTFWTAMSRNQAIQIQYWQFNDSVTKKYLSNNHAAKTLTIGTTDYEFIPNHIWSLVKVGDTIKKQSCNSTIQINDKNVLFTSN
jgi:ABC-type dipeptide/oligopeptide/nickel transport system permease component